MSRFSRADSQSMIDHEGPDAFPEARGPVADSESLPSLDEVEGHLGEWDVEAVGGDVAIGAALGPDAALGELRDLSEETDEMSPAQRVRFDAPVRLTAEGASEPGDGVILNLSDTGFACRTDLGLDPGQRLWAEFAPSLADQPVRLLCEVIWRRRGDLGMPNSCGVRFLSLSDEEVQAVVAVVQERSSGRAGAWPLPIMPTTPTSQPAKPGPWLSAAAGMAAGIALALALSVLPSPAIDEVVPAPGIKPTRPLAATDLDLSSTRGALAAAPTVVATAAPEEAVDAIAGVASIPTSIPTSLPAPTVTRVPEILTTPPAPRNLVAAPSVPAPLARVESNDGTLRPEGAADRFRLFLKTEGSADEPFSFWLQAPRRLVVDVSGARNGFAQKAYDIAHPLASRLRIGQHPGKVRFVIDVAEDARSDVRLQRANDGVWVEVVGS